MRCIASFDDLYEELTSNLTWRIREISTLRKMLEAADNNSARALGRAIVTMLYAHWEGYVKGASESYLRYVAARSIPYERLAPAFFYIASGRYIARLQATGSGLSEKIEACHSIMKNRSKTGMKPHAGLISTRSNLTSSTLIEICTILGLEKGGFVDEFGFIDKILVERRNYVAHGEEVQLDPGEFRTISDRVIGLMRKYKTDIENAALRESYLSG
jgi:MAE_28990/MAE_18760-like HEPN